MSAYEERRFKIVVLSQEEVMQMLTAWRTIDRCDVVEFFVIDGLPYDAKVESVNADWERRGIHVLVSHPSFEMVDEGCIPHFVGSHRHKLYKKDMAQWEKTTTVG